MKRIIHPWLNLALALMLVLLPLGGQAEAPAAPLSLEELYAFSQSMLERAIGDERGAVTQSQEGGYLFEGIGYALNLNSEDLSLDTVLLGAEINMGSIHEEALTGPRGIGVSSTLGETLAAYPNDNPMLLGTMAGAVLYIAGSLPEGLSIGKVVRDGQQVTLVDHAAYRQEGDQVTRQGLQYVIDQDSVVAIRYYGGGQALTSQEAAEEIQAAATLQEQDDYFAYTTENPSAFSREDLRFHGLDFLDMSPEDAIARLGEVVHEERVADSTGEQLRVMQWDGVEITFVYAANGDFARADRIAVNGPGLEGPRGLRVGTRLNQAVLRFEHPEDPPVKPLSLYGDAAHQQPPYGRLDMEGDEAHLYYAIEQGEQQVLFHALFLQEKLVEMSASF